MFKDREATQTGEVNLKWQGAVQCLEISSVLTHSVVLSCSGRLFSFGSNENGELGVRAEVVASDIPLEVEFDWGSLVSRGGVGEVELEKG